MTITQSRSIERIAQAGLVAKGIVYILLGILAFMAAFEMGGQSNSDVDRNGVFGVVMDMPAGTWLLGLIAAGLICYSIWRGIQTFRPNHDGGKETKPGKRILYFLSGLAYLGVAFTAIRMILHMRTSNGDKNQEFASQVLQQSYGQWLLGAAALILAGIGLYQIYYGLSEKYRKHVNRMSTNTQVSSLLLRSGKVGYIARGVVWLIIAYLLLKAALHANSSEAGDTAKAFQFIENSTAGSLLLGALGLGVIAYGVFNFVRARYERLG